MLSGGGVCLHRARLRGAGMSSMLACLLCCPSELLLFGADRLCIEVKKECACNFYNQKLEGDEQEKSKSARYWVESYFF